MKASLRLALLVLLLGATRGEAQDTARTDVSGIIFANFAAGGGPAVQRSANRFDLERIFLTFRAPAGDRVSIRVTTDVFQQRDTTRNEFYGGWIIRAKYAWLQYDALRGTDRDWRAAVRVGLVHTPINEFEEQFFPRFVAPSSFESAGYFQISDAGVAALVTAPSRKGEVYLTLLNGSGFSARENDRFKDLGGRFVWSPLGNAPGEHLNVFVVPWFSVGRRASDYVNGRGSVRPVGTGRLKDRAGLFLAARHPGFTAGLETARRYEVRETADTLAAIAPRVDDVTGSLVAGHVLIRPAYFATHHQSRIAVFGRLDEVHPDRALSPATRLLIVGTLYDLSNRASVSLDMQWLRPFGSSTVPESHTFFVHVSANFP